MLQGCALPCRTAVTAITKHLDCTTFCRVTKSRITAIPLRVPRDRSTNSRPSSRHLIDLIPKCYYPSLQRSRKVQVCCLRLNLDQRCRQALYAGNSSERLYHRPRLRGNFSSAFVTPSLEPPCATAHDVARGEAAPRRRGFSAERGLTEPLRLSPRGLDSLQPQFPTESR